jgi:hypothetical protein
VNIRGDYDGIKKAFGPTQLSKAIKNLPCGKSPGMDGIPSEIVKCGGSVLLNHLYESVLEIR